MNSLTTVKSALITCALALSPLVWTTADGAGFTTEWGFVNDAAFFEFGDAESMPGEVAGSNTNIELGLPTRLDWPDDSRISTLAVGAVGFDGCDVDGDDCDTLDDSDGQGTGSFFTSDPGTMNFTDSIDVTHQNLTIPFPEEKWLREFKIRTRLELEVLASTDAADIGTMFTLPDLELQGFFKETVNSSDIFPAPDDILVIVIPPDAVLVNGDFIFTDMFTHNGFDYKLHIKLAGLDLLPGAVCDLAIPGNGNAECHGLISEESMASTFTAAIGIEAVVPEPASLTILSSSLLGLRMARRRRRRKQ
jgi:hypothetical protein